LLYIASIRGEWNDTRDGAIIALTFEENEDPSGYLLVHDNGENQTFTLFATCEGDSFTETYTSPERAIIAFSDRYLEEVGFGDYASPYDEFDDVFVHMHEKPMPSAWDN
jgi:hypothetical protein